MEIDPTLHRIIIRFLNLSENDNGSPENDYRTVYLYDDGNNDRSQVTLGRGFTQDGGNLWKVLARYIAKGGARADFFRPYQSKMSRADLYQDKAFLKALGESSTEKAMQAAQDEIFDEAYLGPALDWANEHQFKLPLSIAVIADSFLHSGKMLDKLVDSFPDKKPDAAGDEKVWIKKYLQARLDWFTRSTGKLHNCMFRPNFFLGEIQKKNWDLACPLLLKGKGTIC